VHGRTELEGKKDGGEGGKGRKDGEGPASPNVCDGLTSLVRAEPMSNSEAKIQEIIWGSPKPSDILLFNCMPRALLVGINILKNYGVTLNSLGAML
jgi:hypothetical protein